MQKLALLAAASLVLASCGINGTPSNDVTGTISNAPTDQGTIRMAILGVSFGGISNDSTNYLTVTPSGSGVYAADLTKPSGTGAYKLIAYADKDGSKTFNSGDTATKDNNKTLVFVSDDFTGTVIGGVSNLKKGWNLVEGTTVLKSGTPFTGYDLSF